MSDTPINPHVLELLRFTKSHNRHNDALTRVTGEHFNIFQILGIGHREVTTHSPILAELLNPKGSHGQGSAFLRLFLAKFRISEFNAENATVMTEYYVGPVSENSGGRIDIVVNSNGKKILIENKIYAGDQEKQMTRYRGLDQNARLFYLTLHGDEPSNLSKEELNRIKCESISYGTQILAWLKECRKDAACLPNVREILTQYIHLIEELTYQSTTILMNKELIEEVIKSSESLRAFHTLRNAEVAVQTELITRLICKLDEFAKTIGLERQVPLPDLRIKNAGFYFKTKGLTRHNLQIGIAFDKGNYSDFYFGFAKLDVKQAACPVAAILEAVYMKHFPTQPATDNWPVSTYYEHPYRYWRQETFEAIQSGQFLEDLKAKLEILATIARQVCPDEDITQKG